MGNGFLGQVRALAIGALVAVVASGAAAGATPAASAGTPNALALEHAQQIRLETTTRYGRKDGPRLVVTEASSTGVIESYTLLTADLLGVRTALLRRAVDDLTRPRVFVSLGLEPTPTGRDSLGAVPRWPTASSGVGVPPESPTGDPLKGPWPLDLFLDGSRTAAGPRTTFYFGVRTEGTFTSSTPPCSSGNAADLEFRLVGDFVTGRRRFTCADGSGSITARRWLLQMDDVSTSESGVWKVIGGTGAYRGLRGLGTYVDSVLTGDSDDPGSAKSLEYWQGVVDFDTVAPHVAISRVSIRRPQWPSGTYVLRVAFSARDGARAGPVTFVVTARNRYLLAAEAGTSDSGTASIALELRPSTGGHTVRLKVEVSDQVGNERQVVRTLELPDASRP